MTAIALVLTACAGGTGGLGGIIGGGGFQCNPGTQVQLARPQNQAFASNVSSLEIVASDNNTVLGQSPGSWFLQAQGNFSGQPVFTSALGAVPDPGGFHPFPNDFFFSGSLGTTLPAGETWTVSLVQGQAGNATCTPLTLGEFST
ncbi:MAG: hypothetical protein DLM50_04005 [Candidatus Meridianibacter frigidus]|nr:MAG: hypothetical protein DLM50_04005 [Candidatus Eremiobacteraeota bacterium]